MSRCGFRVPPNGLKELAAIPPTATRDMPYWRGQPPRQCIHPGRLSTHLARPRVSQHRDLARPAQIASRPSSECSACGHSTEAAATRDNAAATSFSCPGDADACSPMHFSCAARLGLQAETLAIEALLRHRRMAPRGTAARLESQQSRCRWSHGSFPASAAMRGS